MDAFSAHRSAPPATALSKALLESSSIFCNRGTAGATTIKSTAQLLPKHIPLTKSSSSWIIHIPKFFCSPSQQAFKQVWKTHPSGYHPIKVYGKKFEENRYSQLYSIFDGGSKTEDSDEEKSTGTRTNDNRIQESYTYSGTTRPFIPCDPCKEEELFIMTLCEVADNLVSQLINDGIVKASPSTIRQKKQSNQLYNCCLINWYQPEHHIGLHSDDEAKMDLSVPILSLSWGGPRRFLLRPKPTLQQHALSPVHEILLKDGDLLIMGGKCQEEFKHEVPRIRKRDVIAGNRISWTIRCVKRSKDANAYGDMQDNISTPRAKRRKK
ncbi:2(OG)-Fe(II) oxygenase superfamily protein [Nitzschia inconspicua]|uniref:2(OG)-Fe(II) oxygenase superfamily protein n=1 Tax=Nitzschia inconspicua TaxID=303405 RepID=A0A9K3LS19_9STRA|nr:2(OG)-Fe(II) oxygenase superfamily protein [Nitzschia inconspicua]